MNSHEFQQPFLTEEQARGITCPAERVFALRCLQVGCWVLHQVPIGASIIDFLVINPRQHPSLDKPVGTLVEVTMMKKEDHSRKKVRRHKNDKRRSINSTGQRKDRQVAAMEASGHRWTMLYRKHINNLSWYA